MTKSYVQLDSIRNTLFATDASFYKIYPHKVLEPQTEEEFVDVVKRSLAQNEKITLRAAGTSLAGQTVGAGTIIDTRFLNKILDYDVANKQVKVQPAIVQDELKSHVRKDLLDFAPDTSSSSRAMIGGMIGNNSCGSYSLHYGTTRDHVKELDVILSDGSEAKFCDLTQAELLHKLSLQNLEGDIYRKLVDICENNADIILQNFPHISLNRKNQGYALDEIIRNYQDFKSGKKNTFNLTPLICGSEGTLVVIKNALLKLVELPKRRFVVCAHFKNDIVALKQVDEILSTSVSAIEFIDYETLEITKNNLEQQQNRFWITPDDCGKDPGCVLVIEYFIEQNINEVQYEKYIGDKLEILTAKLSTSAYVMPAFKDVDDMSRIWSLRKASLGLLMGKTTRYKPIAGIEDAAIPTSHLYLYLQKMQDYLKKNSVSWVCFGHASVGVLHLRPEINLNDEASREKLKNICTYSAKLVKQYKGAISGEHGDGRVRGVFLQHQLGEETYNILKGIKLTFDPSNNLNPGVIFTEKTGQEALLDNIRSDFTNKNNQDEFVTGFNWQDDISIFDAVYKCNGAGVCIKKISYAAGVMCPSYQGSLNEAYSTRGRSNLLSFAISGAENHQGFNKQVLKNKFFKDSFAKCLGCKACKSECPANVDMAKLKSELLYLDNSFNIKTFLKNFVLINFYKVLKLSVNCKRVANFVQNLNMVKYFLSVDSRRKLPATVGDLEKWWLANKKSLMNSQVNSKSPKIIMLVDLYTQFQEPEIGKKAINFLSRFCVLDLLFLNSSPRALISSGNLNAAKKELIKISYNILNQAKDCLFFCLEPSEAMLYRDDFLSLIDPVLKEKWQERFIDANIFTFEELILQLKQHDLLPKIKPFPKTVHLHVHCHHKSLAKMEDVVAVLKIIPELEVNLINSTCCGMSGDFGYKNYDLSKSIANLALIPYIKKVIAKKSEADMILASGTSCRHQIKDFAQARAYHTVEIFNVL